MAKSPDDPTLGLDASDWFATVDKVNASTVNFANRMNALATQIEATGSACSNFVLKVSDVDAQGRKLTATIKNTEEGMRVFGKAITQTTGMQDAQIRKMKQQTDELKKQVAAQAAATAQQLKNQFLPSSSARVQVSTNLERQRVLREIGSIQQLIEQGKISASRANSVITSVLSGSTATFTGTSRQIQGITGRLIQGSNQLGSAWQKNATQIINANNQTGKSFGQVGQAGQQVAVRMLISWRDLGRIFAIQALHNVIRAFINSLREAIQTTTQFQIRISEIRTLSQDNQLSFDKWSQSVRNLSDQFGNPILDVAEGTYEAISNQIAKGAEVADFMAKALKFSQVTVSSTADSVNLLSSVLNAYKLNVGDVDKVSAQLFRTIDLGRVRAQDLANEFGRVAPVAASLNISLEELNAAIATITIQGVTPSETLTSIFAIMNKLLKPTDEMVKFLRGLGFESGRAAVAALGFDGVLRKITDAAQAGNVELADLFNEIRSTRGIVAVTRALDNYQSTLNSIRTDSMDKFIKAQEIINESSGKRFEIQLNRIKNIFITDFGKKFIDNLVNIGDESNRTSGILSKTFTGLLQLFGNLEKTTDSAGHSVFQLADILRSLITALTTVVTVYTAYKVGTLASAAATGALSLVLSLHEAHLFALRQGYTGATAANVAFQLSLLKLPTFTALAAGGVAGLTAALNLMVVAVTVLVTGYVLLRQKVEAEIDGIAHKHQEFLGQISTFVDKETKVFVDGLRHRQEVQVKALDIRIKLDLQYIAAANAAYTKFAERQEEIQKDSAKNLRDILDRSIDDAQAHLRAVESQSKQAADNIKAAQEALFKQQENLTSGRFQRQVKLLPDVEQIRATFAEIQRLQGEASKKLVSPTKDSNAAAENLKQTIKLQEQADRLTNDLLEKQVELTKKRKEIQEQISKLQLREQDVAAIRQQRDAVQNIEKLEQQARTTTGKKKNDLLDEIKLRKQAAQDQLQAFRDQAGDDQRAARGLELETELKNIEGQMKALGSTKDLEAQITAEMTKRGQLLKDFNALNDQINKKAEDQIKLEKDRLETLKTVFAEITKFKLPDIKNAAEATKALTGFDEQVKRAQAAGLTDQGVLFELSKKRIELAAQADLAIQKHTLDTNAETLQKQKEATVKLLDDLREKREKTEKDNVEAQKKAQDIIKTLKDFAFNQADFGKLTQLVSGQVTPATLKQIQDEIAVLQANLRRGTIEETQNIKIGDFKVTDLINDLFLNLRTQILAPGKVKELDAIQADADKRLVALGLNITQAEKQLQATKTATESISQFATTVNNTITNLQQLEQSTKAAADRLTQLATQQPVQPVRRAKGGWIPLWSPRGTDTIPAMLTPGEFVVNAFAANKFHSLLESINTRYYAGGGTVSHVSRASSFKIPDLSFGDTTIGDIHIHGIPVSGNIAVDAKVMGRAIRNEIRKGTVLPPRSQE